LIGRQADYTTSSANHESGYEMPDNASQLTAEQAREVYREERAKRLRADGLDQYVHLDGERERFAADPWVEGDGSRDPIETTVDAVILGAGIAALLQAVALHKAGLDRVMLIDKAGDVGGTWYWNRYPGAQCDTESYVYLPFLEETGYVPTEKYAHQPEILEHCQRIARHFDLYRDALFQTKIEQARWDESASEWVIRTDRDDTVRARYFVIAPGRLQSIKLPGIKGIDRFKGKAFHTSRWDWDFTGPDLASLADQRVGIIGTGATGLQAIPGLAEAAKELFVFQRTPAAPYVRNNRPTDPRWATTLEPGWQYKRMWNFTALSTGYPAPDGQEDMVDDGWTEIAQLLATSTKDPEEANLEVMEKIRGRVDTVVKDPAVAAALKPYYRYGCKRPNFHDEFLASFNRPNVHLVDTEGRGPDEITEHAVVVNGLSYELDCLVFATGFDLGMGFLYGTGLDIIGRNGEILGDKWSQGMKTLHGLHSNGFPNFFCLGFTQTAFSVSYTHMAVEQTEHVGHIVAESERRHAIVEASAEAEQQWQSVIAAGQTPELRAFMADCTPSSVNNEGDSDNPNTLGAGRYTPGGNAFFELLRHWRADGNFDGLMFRRS
jgi:cation diffusion facilitator CzcD-associated flavoprotein CzcO